MKSDPSVPKTTTIKISAIVVDMDIQPRANGLRQDHVDEIKAAYLAGEAVDPPVVWNVGKVFKLSQGFHRIEAAKRAGLKELACIVMTGTAAKCLIDAACSNQKHGLKRTNEDKRRCVGILLDALPSLSDRSVAEMAGVGHQVVAAVRAEKHPPDSPQVGESSTYPPTPRTDNDGAAGTPVLGDSSNTAPAKRVGKDGRSYNAAKPKPAPAAEVAAEPDAFAEPVKLPDAPPTPAEQPSTTAADDTPVEVVEPAAEAEAAVMPVVADEAEEAADSLPSTVDAWGIPIQPHAEAMFAAIPAFKQLLATLKLAHKQFGALCETPGGKLLQYHASYKQANVNRPGRWTMGYVENAIARIKDSVPAHTDCPYAYGGEHPERCSICRGTRVTPDLKHFQVPPDFIDLMKAHYATTEEA